MANRSKYRSKTCTVQQVKAAEALDVKLQADEASHLSQPKKSPHREDTDVPKLGYPPSSFPLLPDPIKFIRSRDKKKE